MLSGLFDQLGCGMYTVEASGLITAMNAEGAALLGYDRADLLGRHAHATLHALRPGGTAYPVEQCPLLRVLQQEVRAGAASDAFLHADGSLVAVSWTSTPLNDGDRVDGAVVLFRGAVDQQHVEAGAHARTCKPSGCSALSWRRRTSGCRCSQRSHRRCQAPSTRRRRWHVSSG